MLLLTHVKYAVLIAVLAGLLDIIPYVGAVVAFVPSVLIALFTGGWAHAALVAGLFIVIFQLEGHFIAPNIVSESVGLTPLTVIVAILIGAELLGVAGMFIAVPVAGVLRVLILHALPAPVRRTPKPNRGSRNVPATGSKPPQTPAARERAARRGGAKEPAMIGATRLQVNRPVPEIVSRVDVIGVPMDLGADRRGVDMGPSAVRYARLREGLESLGIKTTHDHGNIHVPVPESASPIDARAKYLPIIRRVCEELAQLVERIVTEGGFPVVLGGDHSIAIGTLAGLYRARKAQPGLIWIDAHGDINTPITSPSGNVHGMPVAISLDEHAIVPERTVLIGLRDVDAGERKTIRERGVRAYTMTDIDRLGMERVIEDAIVIAGGGDRSVHVSFDMDGIDPSEAPGVGTPVRGGISYREAHLAMEALAAAGVVGSMEVTEINPILDERNRTAELAVGLILSALGKTIL